jgi:hypothetical protein
VGSGASTQLELSGDSGQQYVVAPFSLGDHGSVVGAGAASLSFTLSAPGASLQKIKRSDRIEDDLNESETLRLITNRFEPAKGLAQEPWIWNALEKIDANRFTKNTNFVGHESLKEHYETLARNYRPRNSRSSFANLTTNCPATAPAATNPSSTVSLTTTHDGTYFCVGYNSDPTGDTKANVQASVKAVIDSYRNTIYQDQMTTNVKDGYSFNPLIVIVSSLPYDGAFSPAATTVAKRPILYIKDSLSKATLHATIAHEMQHAIVDYYKTRGTTTISETVGVDEGIAHLMEDAFGYGEGNFNSYTLSFLRSFVDGSAILANNDGANAAAARGGAYSLVYFMAMKAGGFTVTNGKPFTGGGMNAVVSLVKQTSKTGPSALAAAFGQTDLTLRVGELIGALFNDNRNFSFSPAEFSVDTYSSITDTLGTTGLTFGTRFNNFKTFTTATTNTLESAASGFTAKNYESYPVLITPESSKKTTVTVGFPTGSANSGVTVVRVK